MLTVLHKIQREKQSNKIKDKSAIAIISIIHEIEYFEKELGESLVENYRMNNSSKMESYSDEMLELFKGHFNKLLSLSDSVYLPFSISEAIKHQDIDPVESIVHIYTECEEWLKANNPEVFEVNN